MKICAQKPNQPEYSLCGDAYDAPETEDDVEDFSIATPGQRVTCEDCKSAIQEIYTNYTIGGYCRKH